MQSVPRIRSTRREPRAGWREILLLVVLAAAPWFALAQDKAGAKAAAPTSTAADAAAAAPIPVQDIATRADEDDALADAVERRARSANTVANLSTRLDPIEASVDGLLGAYTQSQLQRLPVLRLESLERHWRFNLRRFERWHAELVVATQPYLDDAALLTRRRSQWEKTQADLKSRQMPGVLSDRVEALVQRLRRAEAELEVPIGRYLELRRRGNGVEARIQQGQNAVVQAIGYIDSRLMRLDSPPLWALGGSAQDASDAAPMADVGLDIEKRFAREFREADNDRPLILGALQFALLPVLLWFYLRVRRGAPEGMPAGSVQALMRPFSLWLLLAMLAVFLIEPDAPLLVLQAAMVVAVVPVMRLLPPGAATSLGYLPVVVSSLFLLARLGIFALGSDVLYRLFLLALGGLALAAALWTLWRGRESARLAGGQVNLAEDAVVAAPAWRPGRGVRVGALAAVVLLVIATVSNIAGNASLAETLVQGVIDSAYMALMLFAGVSVCTAVVHWLVGQPGTLRLVQAPARASAMAALLLRLLRLGAVAGWVLYATNHLRVLRPTYAFLSSVLSATFEMGEISLSLGNVLVFVLAVLLAFWAARGVRALVHDEVLGRMRVSRGVGNSVASLTYYGVLIIGLLLALSAAGFKVSQLALVFGALGVGIGFGLQGVVNNFVSGLVLMFERPIQPGDTIEVGTMSGTVSDIGLRATTVRTFDGADVVVPNGTLLAGNLVNWTLRDRSRRIELSLGVSYRADPNQVLALLLATASQVKGVVKRPEPSVFFTGFGPSALEFSVRVWTFDFDNWYVIRSELATRVHQALTEAGIEIPFPQTDLHVRSVAPEVAAAVLAARREAEPPSAAGPDAAAP
ncbi:mechanosensitive ion channel domain-containing protein [Variovorax sp.]|uniref:mechanosensitive ion channel domain-containing protein n=1 Tax=Variovorax sp. TaxID=1871043 RepID=UPI002D47D155|nr:mechanosensitive ion channel domain-containing protein [Variovorax sp.]HYP84983.1 mechanosensitive ion channel domain-containing protein [Variovorax sp.]